MACNSQTALDGGGVVVNSSCPLKHAVNATAAEKRVVEAYWRS
jgi:hypothetical protein